MFILQIFSQITPPTTTIPVDPDPSKNVVMLLNFVLRIIFFVAGLWSLWNFISAGFKLISSGGDAKVLEAVQGQFVWTFVGIVIMVSAIIVAGIIGIIAFGHWDAIINPHFSTLPTS